MRMEAATTRSPQSNRGGLPAFVLCSDFPSRFTALYEKKIRPMALCAGLR